MDVSASLGTILALIAISTELVCVGVRLRAAIAPVLTSLRIVHFRAELASFFVIFVLVAHV